MPAANRRGLGGMPGWRGCTVVEVNKEEISPLSRIWQHPADGTLRSPRSAR